MKPNRQTNQADPNLLDLVGQALELLGLAEHVQRYLPLQRMGLDRRHRRIERRLTEFQDALDDARASLRIARSALTHLETVDVPEDAFGVVMPIEEFAVYRRGLDQLAASVRKMRNAALDLEAATIGLPQAQERYHRLSAAGRNVLDQIRGVLAGRREEVLPVLDAVERYLVRASELMTEAIRMREL